jgi:hypothetical protein
LDKDATASQRTVVLVLGMHRSGTSMLAGALGLLGAGMPKVGFGTREDNPKGHFEPAEIVAFHDRVLASAGCHWWDWDPFPEGWFASAQCEAAVAELAALVETEFGSSPLFVVKDPRLCKLVPLWTRVIAKLGLNTLAVLPYRNPIDVAASLHRRDRFPTANCQLMWLRYVLDAEVQSRTMKRAVVSYEKLLSDWRPGLEALLERLDLNMPRQSFRAYQELEEFIDSELRHNAHDPEALAQTPGLHPWVAEAYAAYHTLEADAADHSAQAELDRIRAAFDLGCRAFTPALHGTTRGFEDAQARNGLIPALEATIAQLRNDAARVPSFESALAQAEDRISVLRARVQIAEEGREDAVQELRKRLDAIEGAIGLKGYRGPGGELKPSPRGRPRPSR